MGIYLKKQSLKLKKSYNKIMERHHHPAADGVGPRGKLEKHFGSGFLFGA